MGGRGGGDLGGTSARTSFSARVTEEVWGGVLHDKIIRTGMHLKVKVVGVVGVWRVKKHSFKFRVPRKRRIITLLKTRLH